MQISCSCRCGSSLMLHDSSHGHGQQAVCCAGIRFGPDLLHSRASNKPLSCSCRLPVLQFSRKALPGSLLTSRGLCTRRALSLKQHSQRAFRISYKASDPAEKGKPFHLGTSHLLATIVLSPASSSLGWGSQHSAACFALLSVCLLKKVFERFASIFRLQASH